MTKEITYEVRICIQCGRVWIYAELTEPDEVLGCAKCGGLTDEFTEITHQELINRLGLPDWRP